MVLTNTQGLNAYAIGRALARAVLGLPELERPAARPERHLSDLPVSAEERKQFTGTFLLLAGKLPANLNDSVAQYRRTYRVFDENGRLTIQALGLAPERLMKQDDGSFAMRSASGTRIWFEVKDGLAVGMRMEGGLPLAGERVGDGDPETFHRQLR